MKLGLVSLMLVLSSTLFAQSLPICKDRAGQVMEPSVTLLKRYVDSNNARRPQVFVEGIIKEVLPEDQNGTPHQKFILSVSGIKVQLVHSLDYGRLPLRVGSQVQVCGEFLNSQGGLIHWTHFDPGGHHPDGFVAINGDVYGQTETR